MRLNSFVLIMTAACLCPSLLVVAEGRTLKNVMVATRDGVKLATDVYLPEDEEGGSWPCVLSRTPYDKNGLKGAAKGFVERGFAFVAQDVRGKHRSKGEYAPFRTDHHDGYDAVEWVARQNWSDGKVGMWGGSALGITSNLAATQVPPHLKCAYVIVAGASARSQTVFMGGVYRKKLNDGWLMLQGAGNAIEANVGNPAGSSYWDWREIADFHHRIEIPIYNSGGWFDIFAQGTIDNFVGLQARGAGLAAGNQKLLMGPWAHGALGGRLKFPGARAEQALNADRAYRWFERWLKGVRNGIDTEPPVRYYVLGDSEDPKGPGNEWRTARAWPPPSRPVSFFLHPGSKLKRGEPAAEHHTSRYSYDPDDPVMTVGGANLFGGKGPIDQRAIGERKDYLRFQSEVLERPLEVAGRVWVDLFISSDAPDTDFVAKLVDVYPDGYEALLGDGILRARYREGLQKEVFLKKEEVVRLRIDLWSTAIVFNKGHRIALHVTSSNAPRFEPNPNTGKPLRADDEKRVARNAVHTGPSFPSRLLLPVVREYEEEAAEDESDR